METLKLWKVCSYNFYAFSFTSLKVSDLGKLLTINWFFSGKTIFLIGRKGQYFFLYFFADNLKVVRDLGKYFLDWFEFTSFDTGVLVDYVYFLSESLN